MQKDPKWGYGLAFTRQFKGIARELDSSIFIFEPNQKKNKIQLRAIWDTGATATSIHPKIAKKLKLIPVGKQQIFGVTGNKIVNNYFVDILLPNNVIFPNIKVSACDWEGDWDVLIGMDIIAHGDFAVTQKNENTIMSFRIPALQTIDFVHKIKTTQESDKRKTLSKNKKITKKRKK